MRANADTHTHRVKTHILINPGSFILFELTLTVPSFLIHQKSEITFSTFIKLLNIRVFCSGANCDEMPRASNESTT